MIFIIYVKGLFLIQYLETSRAPVDNKQKDPVALRLHGFQIPIVYLKL